MRTNTSSPYAGIHKANNRYFVNVLVMYPHGARVQRKYFDTIGEAIMFRRANKEITQ